MDLFYCSKCKKWFDLNDKFEPLILGTKSPTDTTKFAYAELPLPELPQWPCNNEFFSKVRDESEGKIDV